MNQNHSAQLKQINDQINLINGDKKMTKNNVQTLQVVPTSSLHGFDAERQAIIKSQISPHATNAEFDLFCYQAWRTGLDPILKQIHCIHRFSKADNKHKMTIQTGIDGFRIIAERSGNYGGQDEPVFEINSNNDLVCAKVTVYKFRGDTRYPAAVGVAYMKEYKPAAGVDFIWRDKPYTMLAKVAEAIALRKAFPQDLSGLYTGDEMGQAADDARPMKSVNTTPPNNTAIQETMNVIAETFPDTITKEQAETLRTEMDKVELPVPKFCASYNIPNIGALPAVHYDAALVKISAYGEKKGG